MGSEKIPLLFPGQRKIEEEAHLVNKKVDDYFKNPRTNKSRSASDVAHEMIKKQKDNPVSPDKLSEEERRWYKNILSSGVRFLDSGFLEISRWDDADKSGQGKKRIWQKVDGINSAIRMQDNILDRYRTDEKSRSEFTHLESIQEVIESANELMLEWKTAGSEEKKSIQFRLAEVVLQLEKCRNEFKLDVKDQSGAVMKMKDSLDRDNPSALAARTVAALNSLAKRMNEMQLIMPNMAMRKETLILEKRRISRVLKKASSEIIGILHHQLFSENSKKPLESKINDNEVKILDRKIGKALYFLGTIHVLPYSHQAEQAKFFLSNRAKIYFSSRKKLLENPDLAKKELMEAVSILESDIEQLG